MAINMSTVGSEIIIGTRGAHNVNYSFVRISPTFDLGNRNKNIELESYRQRFKDLPKSEQGKTTEHADFSDSDVEEDYLLLGSIPDDSNG